MNMKHLSWWAHHVAASSRGPHGGQVDDVASDLGLAPVLQEVDVEVDGAVEGGQQVAGAGHVGQPARPLQLGLDILK